MKKVLLSIVFLAIMQGCSEDEPSVRIEHNILTQAATGINAKGAALQGRIVELGSTDIVDHGFILSESVEFTEGNTTIHALGVKEETGSFSVILTDLNVATTYHYKSYAKDEDGEVFGSSLSFTTTSPNITGIEPAEAVAGEEVTISGTDFITGMSVLFGETEAEIASLSPTSVKVLVPKDIGIVPVVLSVSAEDSQYTSEVEFLPIVGKWEQLNPFPGDRRNAPVTFTIEGKSYMGLGWIGEFYNDMWEYDPSTDTWKQLNNFPELPTEILTTSFSIDGVGYVGIGYMSNEFWKYDAQNDLWTRVADFPGSRKGTFLSNNNKTFVIDGKAYVGRGKEGDTDVEFWMYDPQADSWTLKTTFPEVWQDFRYEGSTDLHGYVLLRGEPNNLWRYTPSTNQWNQMNDAPASSLTFYVNGKLYANSNLDDESKNIWQYDEQNDEWIQISNFSFNVGNYIRFEMVNDGNGYLGLGETFENGFYKFTPPSE